MGTFMPNVSKIVLPWSPNAGNDLAGDVCFFVQFSTNSRGYDVSSCHFAVQSEQNRNK
jgi:hypothetical protein